MSSVTVVVPVHGQFGRLSENIKSIPQGVPIHIVDDFTPDPAERKQIKEWAYDNRYAYFKNDSNKGFPATVNRGAMRIKTPLMMVLNTDVFLQDGAFDALTKEFEDKDVGVAAPFLVFSGDSPNGPGGRIQHAGIVFTILAQPVHLFIGWNFQNPRVKVRRDTLQAVSGACIMTRTALFKNVGGFNEQYGRGTYEDVEYCFLARMNKFKVVCTPAALGSHYVGASLDDRGYPLNQNQRIFMARLGNAVSNDDYRYL